MDRSPVYGTGDSRFDPWWGYVVKDNCEQSPAPTARKEARKAAQEIFHGKTTTGKFVNEKKKKKDK